MNSSTELQDNGDSPALPPPPGESTDFAAGYRLLAAGAVTLALTVFATTFAVGARMYTRRFITRQWGFEDYVCIASWALFVAYSSITANIGFNHHGGMHMWDHTTSDVKDFNKWINIIIVIYYPLIAMTKLAILLLYVRFFTPSRSGVLFIIIVVTMFIVASYYVAFAFATIFACWPRARIFDKPVPGQCINANMDLISAAFNLFTNFFIWALPFYKLWNLRVSMEKKLGVVVIFAFGSM